MARSIPGFCDEMIVSLLRDYPVIWNQDDRNYRSQYQRSRAFTELRKAMQLPTSGENWLRERWKRIRKEYVASLRNKDDSVSSSISSTVVDILDIYLRPTLTEFLNSQNSIPAPTVTIARHNTVPDIKHETTSEASSIDFVSHVEVVNGSADSDAFFDVRPPAEESRRQGSIGELPSTTAAFSAQLDPKREDGPSFFPEAALDSNNINVLTNNGKNSFVNSDNNVNASATRDGINGGQNNLDSAACLPNLSPYDRGRRNGDSFLCRSCGCMDKRKCNGLVACAGCGEVVLDKGSLNRSDAPAAVSALDLMEPEELESSETFDQEEDRYLKRIAEIDSYYDLPEREKRKLRQQACKIAGYYRANKTNTKEYNNMMRLQSLQNNMSQSLKSTGCAKPILMPKPGIQVLDQSKLTSAPPANAQQCGLVVNDKGELMGYVVAVPAESPITLNNVTGASAPITVVSAPNSVLTAASAPCDTRVSLNQVLKRNSYSLPANTFSTATTSSAVVSSASTSVIKIQSTPGIDVVQTNGGRVIQSKPNIPVAPTSHSFLNLAPTAPCGQNSEDISTSNFKKPNGKSVFVDQEKKQDGTSSAPDAYKNSLEEANPTDLIRQLVSVEKKKRGRPKKLRRKRGRPRKYPLPSHDDAIKAFCKKKSSEQQSAENGSLLEEKEYARIAALKKRKVASRPKGYAKLARELYERLKRRKRKPIVLLPKAPRSLLPKPVKPKPEAEIVVLCLCGCAGSCYSFRPCCPEGCQSRKETKTTTEYNAVNTNSSQINSVRTYYVDKQDQGNKAVLETPQSSSAGCGITLQIPFSAVAQKVLGQLEASGHIKLVKTPFSSANAGVPPTNSILVKPQTTSFANGTTPPSSNLNSSGIIILRSPPAAPTTAVSGFPIKTVAVSTKKTSIPEPKVTQIISPRIEQSVVKRRGRPRGKRKRRGVNDLTISDSDDSSDNDSDFEAPPRLKQIAMSNSGWRVTRARASLNAAEKEPSIERVGSQPSAETISIAIASELDHEDEDFLYAIK